MPIAVVTGANSGIGHAFAQILIKEVIILVGTQVPMLDLNFNQGFETHAGDRHAGDKLKSLECQAYQLDVTSPESIRKFADQLKGKAVDLLLNIAGNV
jgi:NAD(P)-dependent dehydrogenase (short-subunit alcohol dehydrogenase family)